MNDQQLDPQLIQPNGDLQDDSSSYVDDYQPPVSSYVPPVAPPITPPMSMTPPEPIDVPTAPMTAPTAPMTAPTAPMTAPTTPPVVAPAPVPNIMDMIDESIDDELTADKPASYSDSSSKADASEALEDQNIFHLLGVDDGSDDEKEAFLDELQQVIWEDFIENDVKLLITAEEMTQFRQMMSEGDGEEMQEEMVVFLEKLIPDLEEIMLEKALELKEDMVWERIEGMREYYLDQPESLAKLDQANELAKKNLWHQAAEMMNSMAD